MSTSHPVISRDAIFFLLKNRSRWDAIAALIAGEPLEMRELAAAAGCSYQAMTKHVAEMKRLGLVEIGRGHLVRLADHLDIDREAKTIDFGHLLARFDGKNGGQ